MTIPLDYETLRVIWWLLLGLLLIGFAITGGYDLGVAILLRYVARNDVERRITINAIGPFWEGNQVWLILGAGAVFAAWPEVYAATFSGFYVAMFLVLAALILRPVGFKFRNGFADTRWRAFWDYALFLGGVLPSLIFGVAFGNLLQGVPFRIDSDLRVLYEGGGLLELLNPFGLLSGLVSAAMLATHGAAYLALKTDDAVQQRARDVVKIGGLATFVLFVAAGLWVWLGIDGYAITSVVTSDGSSNPLLKTVVRKPGQWLANYRAHHWMILAPLLGVLGPLLIPFLAMTHHRVLTFVASALGIFGIVGTAGVSMFPFLVPSNIAPEASLTVWDASSSRFTLFVMLLATLIFLPIVLAYTAIVFRAMRGPVTASLVEKNSASFY
ncbi:cytochrome d ubiquinol oxidase subunit II [Bradyrhizobium sp. Arg816]|uniref:cytochrome d ubiquinol oxidase subunit II n=1 Tax=Bradyrhizobium sp. Arg816 TaxID=2998491 RepID=UPI00249E3F55|nr:cytochrome d ubiquinol oxidase subunit II [Bradyrhizobium sp. Arg816]MDI3560633.1 cytochrome d ubiquinol oxidase subunit II [Bradyrhizobium sp. Arg816]